MEYVVEIIVDSYEAEEINAGEEKEWEEELDNGVTIYVESAKDPTVPGVYVVMTADLVYNNAIEETISLYWDGVRNDPNRDVIYYNGDAYIIDIHVE